MVLCHYLLFHSEFHIQQAPKELRIGEFLSTQAFQAGSEFGDLWPFQFCDISQDAAKKKGKTLLLWGWLIYKSVLSTTDSFSLVKYKVLMVCNDKPNFEDDQPPLTSKVCKETSIP